LIAGRPVRLSRAQLETLAIVAYRQPITRPEVDEIRGVDSSATLRLLMDRSLIRILGKKEDVGRPILYGTTKEFLDFFSLGDLRELPTLREYSELTDESRKVMSDRLGIAPDKPDPDGGEGGTSGDGGSMPPSGEGDGGAGSDTPADVGAAPEVVDLDEVFARAPESAQAESGASWIAAIRADASATDPAPGDSPGDSSESPDVAPDEPAADDDHGGDTATVLEKGPRPFDDASDDGLGDATVAEKPDAANVDEPEDNPEQEAATPDAPILDVTDRQILEAHDAPELAANDMPADIATGDAASPDDGEFADGSGPTLEPAVATADDSAAVDAVVQMSYEPDASWPDASDGVEAEPAPHAATELCADDELAPEHPVMDDAPEPSLASITTLASDPVERFDAAAAELPIGLGMTASHSNETLEPDGDSRSELVPPTIESDPRSLGDTPSTEPVSD
ncbi:MAG TPA: SMC-Scp complex subunit ScpB, partial [Kofleriaceae bacterium]|nr:SMC-Scp complex subunit ScpB [Kofleriaceae bacterium]